MRQRGPEREPEHHGGSHVCYIVDNGPTTDQERWENQGGYSPIERPSIVACRHQDELCGS